MTEEMLWALAGIVTGIFTGLAPGIHANTIAFIGAFSASENGLGFAMFIVSMSITHSFFDAVPSILLGAPSEESSLNLLPGHGMLLRGEGMKAIRLTAFGGLATVAFAILFTPVFLSLAENYEQQVTLAIPALITGTMLLMLWTEKRKKEAAAVMLASGLLGSATLNFGVREPVFALIIGFFALPGLAQSVFTKAAIPEQETGTSGSANVSMGAVSALTSGLLAIVPGIGPSQAAAIVRAAYRKLETEEYLVLNGGINTGNLFFSVLMLYSLGKMRTGMAAALDRAIQLDWGTTMVLLATAAFAAGISAVILPAVAENSINTLRRVDYGKASIAAIAIVVLLVAGFSGIAGVAACCAAAGISLFALSSKTKRSNCMAFLLFPTLAYYLGA